MGNQYRTEKEEKQEAVVKQKEKSIEEKGALCPGCGKGLSISDIFCPECGKQLKKMSTCSFCGAAVEPGWEICGHCGHNLRAECCSFCGAASGSNGAFCSVCGNPKGGIICPDCHTVNFRNFCRKCNTPLNDMAQEALQQIQQKPELKKALSVAQELEKLEEIISQFNEAESGENDIHELSEESREFVNQYKELLGAFRGHSPEERTAGKDISVPKQRKKFTLNISGKEEAIAQYNAKLEEMKQTLSSLFPNPEMTPQMQRDYYTAIKVEIISKVKVKVGWKCNAYGCVHNQPNDCAEPFMGGTWIYKEVDKSTWVHQ